MQQFRIPIDLQLFAGEKTESATPRKRNEARQKGQVAKSMELPGAFILLFSFLALLALGKYFKQHLYDLFTNVFHNYMLRDLTIDNVTAIFGQLIYQGVLLLAPIMLVTVVIATLGNYVQIGFLLTGEPLFPKFSKLNPIEGAKRIFSLRAMVDFIKSLLKLMIIGFIAYLTLWNEKTQIVALGRMPLEHIFDFTSNLTITLGIKIGVALVVLAVFDYMYQRYEYEKSLRMSKQDIKDEYKKTEGDPFIKGKIREKQRRMAMQRMMQEVPQADVVITNPTHFAVALQYDTTKMSAPVVIAKGMDYIALKIKEIARQNDVITMENKPLAQALYHQVEIGEAVPAELFQAVAEVLAYVYKVKRKA